MNVRLTVTAAVAVVLASVSVYPLVQGAGWFWGGVGAVLVAAAAGAATRLSAVPTAVFATALALIAFFPLFTGPSNVWHALGALLVAAAVASASGRPVLRLSGCLVAYLAALLLYLNATFAGRQSLAALLPTRASLHHLGSLVSQGLALRAYAPPVPGSHGAVLLAAGGIGLMAVLTDLLAVRLRSPAIAGLPLLALYSVPIMTNSKEGALGATAVFCLGMTGYLALLAADGRDRLRLWGRLVTVWQHRTDETPQAPDTSALAASGRRVGLAAVGLAIVIPLLVPGARVHSLFGTRAGTGGSGGGSHVRLPDPLVQMQQQLHDSNPQTVLTYHTSAALPAQQYLQVYVLNLNAENGSWTLVTPGRSTRVGGGQLRAAPGVSADTTEVTTNTQVKLATGVRGYGSRLAFLPLPYAPTALRVRGAWEEDNTTLMVYSTRTSVSGLHYRVTSKQAEPSAQELSSAGRVPAAIAAGYLPLPAGGHRAQLEAIARSVTASAHTPYQKALALQNWLANTGGFRYQLHVDLPDSTAGLVKFLTKTRRGFCQQFSFAMAVLARFVHIPSRIAVGYTAGKVGPHGNGRVTTAYAHSWPELYFPGAGWLRFEPTPGGADGTATQPDYTGGTGLAGPPNLGRGPTGGSSAAPTTHHGSGINSKLNHLGLHDGPAGAQTPRQGGDPAWLIIVIAAGVLAIAPRTARSLTRRRRWHRAAGDAGLAHAAWLEFRDDLADHGMSYRASESPRAVARRVAVTLGLDPGTRAALDRIADAEERARYAPVPPERSGTLRQDVGTVRRGLSGETGAVRRWRAWLMPPSTLAPVGSGLQQVLDVFGWMEAAGNRLAGRRERRRADGLADSAS